MSEANTRYHAIIRDGLPRAAPPQRVIIVGAGMAGLVAAYELLRAALEVHQAADVDADA